ncbi:MAG: acylphosphatase [archaeon]|nr:MAG: acylphosphatase [archaeon]
MKLRIRVYGKVQGVFFRARTRNKARELGLGGWVKNREDGTVEILAQGNRAKELAEWCRKGFPDAKVDRVETREEKSEENFSGFEVRY